MSELTTHLIVDAGHPAVRIEVLDAGYRVRASGYGRIEQDLPTGFYTIQYKAAEAVQERDITLRPNEPLTIDEPPDLPFASAAPLEFTSTSHEYHQDHAHRLSRATPLERGSGSRLFVFVRDLEPGGLTHPAKGLSLHRLDGETVVLFDEVIESSKSKDQARWGGRNLAVDAGFYRLRLALPEEKAIEMIVPACPEWQSQVFLLRQGGESEVSGKAVLDLPNAAQLMARPGDGFNPRTTTSQQRRIDPVMAGEDLRLVELARMALGRGSRGITADDLSAMLHGKWEDPLLGILGAHLLLQQTEPDLNLADHVVDRMRGQILSGFRHPDIDAIALEIARRRGEQIAMPPFEAPPMLRRSWNYLVQATAEWPELIPSGSLAFQIANRLWGTSAWLIWEAPPQAPARKPTGEPAESWLESISMPSPSKTQAGIMELDDRVIIGGVTLYKRGVSRGAKGEPETMRGMKGFAPEPEVERGGVESTGKAPPGQPQTETSVDLADFKAVRVALEDLLLRWQDFFVKMGVDKLVRKAQLTGTEYALLVQFLGQQASSQRDYVTPTEPLTLENLVVQLRVPAEIIQAALASLYAKLLALLPREK